jgi:hypothetical protein
MVLLGTATLIQSNRRVAVSDSLGVSEFGSRHNQCEAGGGTAFSNEAADAGLLSPELAAGIRRVKGVRKLGVRLGKLVVGKRSS